MCKSFFVYRLVDIWEERGLIRMKKSKLYRIGSVFLAAAIVFTCVPQTGLYAFAAEIENPADGAASQDEPGRVDAKPSTVSLDDNMADDGLAEENPEGEQPQPGVDDAENGQEDTGQPEADQDNGDEPGQEPDGEPDIDGGPEEKDPQEPEGDGMTAEEPQEPERAMLTVTPREDTGTEKEDFEVDFTTQPIQVKDKTYDTKKHSISGYPLWSPRELELKLELKVTGTTKEGTSYEKTKDVTLNYNSVATAFAEAYGEIAPTDCGSYTLEILVDTTDIADQYNIPDSGLETSFHFWVLPLKEMETKITGIPVAAEKNGKAYLADKVYDGNPYDLSGVIRNTSVRAYPKDYPSGSSVDITGVAAPLEFRIQGRTAGSDVDDFEVKDAENISVDKMPTAAGEYVLSVKLVPDSKENYEENEALYYFAINKQALTITVNDQEMHVGDEGLSADEPLSEDQFQEQYQIEGLLAADNDEFIEKLKIVSTQDIDSTKTGVYEHVLAVSGIDEEEWPDYDITWSDAGLTVKGQLHQIQSEIKAVTNIPNGTSLVDIADKYLPKRTTIYLYNGGKKPADVSAEPDIPDTAEITWDTTRTAPGSSYNVSTDTAQTFKMQGTVVLPELVYAEADTSLTVTVSVSVREAATGQALRPYADTPGGKVGEGTRVRLFTEEAGAQIYYTVDASDPSTSKTSRLYDSYIEIRNTMTVKAIARVTGKRDSEVLRVDYYYDKTLKPGGSDDPDEPEVPDEDIPRDENGNKLPIPDDLWVTDVEEYVYTGKAIKPEVRVYDYKTRLEEKKDYTISYKNNTNAADKDHPTKAPTITITGKGNYEGKLLKTFTIAPKNITDSDVKADDLAVAFNNKAQKPAPTVTWNGKKLTSKKDYSFDATPQTAVGSYSVTLTGTGNYTGERKISFIITDGVPASKLTVAKIPAYTYTGEAITPVPVVKYGKEVLAEGNYTVSYEDNIEVGTAAVIITCAANSRFAGVKRVTFSIKEAALMNKAKIAMQFASGTMYTGKEITATAYDVTVSLKVDGVTQTRTLVKDKDYKVTYQNNIKAGTATAVFEGINAYRGTQKKTFKITAYNLLLDPNKKMDIQAAETYPYMKGGSTQKPVVKFDGKTLTEGTDYTLSYKSHTAAGNFATMTIKGKGNFTGSATKGYLVEVQNLSNMTVTPADKVYQAKANIYKTTVRVYDTNGKLLSAGKDYDKNVVYTYSVIPSGQAIVTADNTVRKVGDVVAATDIIPYGTKIKVTVNAAGSNYQGTAEGVYSITRADIAKAKVTVPQQTYTGKPIELTEKEITVLMGGMSVSPEEYKIIGYTNNVNKGTAKLTIQGQGNYGGTKTVTFKIKGKSLLNLFG